MDNLSEYMTEYSFLGELSLLEETGIQMVE